MRTVSRNPRALARSARPYLLPLPFDVMANLLQARLTHVDEGGAFEVSRLDLIAHRRLRLPPDVAPGSSAAVRRALDNDRGPLGETAPSGLLRSVPATPVGVGEDALCRSSRSPCAGGDEQELPGHGGSGKGCASRSVRSASNASMAIRGRVASRRPSQVSGSSIQPGTVSRESSLSATMNSSSFSRRRRRMTSTSSPKFG